MVQRMGCMACGAWPWHQGSMVHAAGTDLEAEGNRIEGVMESQREAAKWQDEGRPECRKVSLRTET